MDDHEHIIEQRGVACLRVLHDLTIRAAPEGVTLEQEAGLDSVLVAAENVPLLIDTLRQFQAMREPA